MTRAFPTSTLLCAIVLVAGLAVARNATADAAVPALAGPVTDLTGTLTSAQIASLDQSLEAFEARKGSQIAVLIVPSTAPEAISQFGIRVAEHWKIGRKHLDDGAILIIAKNDRAARIEVGYGLEGVLTDATSEDIISDTIGPHLRTGDFYGGISAGVQRMMRVIGGASLPTTAGTPAADASSVRQYGPLVLIVAVLVGGFLRSALGRVPGAIVAGGALGILTWFAAGALTIALGVALIAFLFTLFGGGMVAPLLMGGGWGGFGGSGMGGLGGGFSGGGGRFGGGGASGRW